MANKQPLISELSRRFKLSLLLRYLGVGDRVLEIGSGSGWFAEKLRANNIQVVTIDLVSPADFIGDICQWRKLVFSPIRLMQ